MANKYNYQFTDLALVDIENVLKYISDSLMNKIAAKNLIDLIEKTIENICLYPYSYPDCYYYFIDDITIRHAAIKHYILIYKINNDTSSIEILRFKYFKQKELL